MTDLIAIPTKDRPKELRRLLGELYAQKVDYGHSLPIYVFDHSPTDSASGLVEEFRDRLEVYHRGSMHRTRLIDEVSKQLGINRKVAERIFSYGFGGNRNFILGMTPHDRVISLDDDVLPVSCCSRTGQQDQAETLEQALADRDPVQLLNFLDDLIRPDGNEVIGYSNKCDPSACSEERYDLIKSMMRYLGRDIKGLCFPLGKTLDFQREPVGKVILEGKNNNRNGRITTTYPLLSFHTDDVLYKQGNQAFVYSQLRPAITESMVVGYSCYAADHGVFSQVPFVPTRLRYEDVLHQYMMDNWKMGMSLMLGCDVKHERGSRPQLSMEDCLQEEHFSRLTHCLIAFVAARSNSLDELSNHLKQQRLSSQAFVDGFIAVSKPSKKYLEKIPPISSETRARLPAVIGEDLRWAAATFGLWEKIISFLRDKNFINEGK